ncbi:hypothetical protein WJX79_005226 [Trebouxia sp. C0005]
MEPTKLISLADFHRIQFVAARIASVKVNKTARVPAYLCSLELGTPLMECSHDVQPGLLVTLTGKSEQLKTNSRDLTWQNFTAANIKVGTVTDARLDTSIQHIESGRAAYIACIDFGANTGVQPAHAILDSKVFASPDALLHKQMLALTNLVNNNPVTPIILSVGGQAVLQPAKPVANGYVLA